jgi:carboxyl-terminal processing protease
MRKKILIFLILGIISLLFIGFTKDYYYKVNKSFDLFGAIFREVTSNYVLEIDPEILMKGAIKGMLSTLDPYTEFYDATDQENFDLLTQGAYTGFGISLANIDSILTITEVRDGYSASELGLRIGDNICKIDSFDVKVNNYVEVLNYIKGENTKKALFYVLREGISDTLKFELTKTQILLENVKFYDIFENSIGYIKLEHFNKTAAQDFRFALNNLKKRVELSSLIIDLRDNPGGLLESAVQICEMFLPYGSVIVKTKGRNNEELYTYQSSSNPIEPTLPLVILINEGSASASEVIAGALQDYDRAVIVGKRSYGKGLVQSILPLPYNSNLKITTAKYYTPSGRCIQRIKFGEAYYDNSKVSENLDTTIYYTANGRKVFESTGIHPDTSLTIDYYSDIFTDLLSKFYLFKFGNFYTGKLDSLPHNFKADDKLFNKLTDFLKTQNYNFVSRSAIYLNELDSISKHSKYSESFTKNLKNLKKSVEIEEKDLLKHNKEDILKYLDIEIRSRFTNNKEIERLMLGNDEIFNLSKNIIKSGAYSKILTIDKTKTEY